MEDDLPRRHPTDLPLVTLDNNALIAVRENEPAAEAVRTLLEMSRDGRIVVNITLSSGLEAGPSGEPWDWQEHIAWLEGLGIARGNIFTGPRTIAFSMPDAPGVAIFNPDWERELNWRIHAVLFPNIPFGWREYLAREATRRGTLEQATYEYDAAESGFYIPPTPQSPRRRPTPTYDALSSDEQEQVRVLRAFCHRRWHNAKNDALGFYNHCTNAWYTTDPEWAVFVTSDGNFHKQTKFAALNTLGYRGKILRPREAVEYLARVAY